MLLSSISSSGRVSLPFRFPSPIRILPVIALALGFSGLDRSAAVAGVAVVDAEVSTTTAKEGQTVTVRYEIESAEQRDVLLDTHIHSGAHYMIGRETPRDVTLQPGTHWYEREFLIRPGPEFPYGSYTVHYRVTEPGSSTVIAAKYQPDGIQIEPAPPLEVPVLSYNKVGPEFHNWFWIETPVFQDHMRELHERGYTAVTLDDAMAYRAGEKTPPEKPVVIAFHGGYQEVMEEVDPILEQYGFQATVFTIAAYAGMTNDNWDTDTDPLLRHPSWDELRDWKASGRWHVESGSMHHVDFDLVGLSEARQEAIQSREKLEEELGTQVRYFAYPWGHGTGDPDITTEVWRAGYHAAFGIRKEVSTHDNFRLPRFDVHNAVHTDPDREPEQWYLFGSGWLGRGTAQPPPNQFEWYPDEAPAWSKWQEEHFSPEDRNNEEISGETATPAGDLVPNLLKYAFGLAPHEFAPREILPLKHLKNGHLKITYRRPIERPDLEYRVEVSEDLDKWFSGKDYTEIVRIEEHDELQEFTVRDRTPANDRQRFIRLRVLRVR